MTATRFSAQCLVTPSVSIGGQPVGLIADDLTGAADAGLAFQDASLDVAVYLTTGWSERPAPVVAIDQATRHLHPSEAARQVAHTVQALQRHGVRMLFQKIDSTLRGNPGAEIEAALLASRARLAVVCPAFPAAGRTVETGRLYIHGRDLLASESGRDLRNSVSSSSVAEVLRSQTDLPILELHEPDQPVEGVGTAGGKWMAVADGTDERQLRRWVTRFGLEEDVLWAGSAGLAHAVAAELARTGGYPRREFRYLERRKEEPVLLVVGSLHPACRSQVHSTLTLPDLISIRFDPADIVDERFESGEVGRHIAAVMREGRSVVIDTEPAQQRLDSSLARLGRDREWAGEMIATRLGSVVRAASDAAAPLRHLVLTGGDTARAALEAIGVERLRIVGAVAPGMPVGRAGEIQVVTKAGGFGEPEVLAQAVTLLRKGDWQ